MRHPLRLFLSFVALCCLGAMLLGLWSHLAAGRAPRVAPPVAADPTKPRLQPGDLPVKARLVARTATYKLDLGGMTPERFREALKEAGKKNKYPIDAVRYPEVMTPERLREAVREVALAAQYPHDTDRYPKAPAVDLALELTNAGDEQVRIWDYGESVRLMLKLKGKGAVTVETPRILTREYRLPRALALAPGRTHTIPIKSLQCGRRGVSWRAYWTEADRYTLTASFETALSPPPPGKEDGRDGFAPVTLTAEPVEITVEAK